MTRSYEVRCGRRTVARQTASSAPEALAEYLRGLGCHRDEVVRMGANASSWRGAVYRAVPADDDGRRAA